MEKIIYVLSKKDSMLKEDFKNLLLDEVSKQILWLGIHALSVSVDDDRVSPAKSLRQVNVPPDIHGIISIFLNTHMDRGPIENIIGQYVATFSGYLVVESVPIVNTAHPGGQGKATPGMNQVAFLSKTDGLSYDEFIKIWQTEHTRVAIETQSTFRYVQNVAVRPLTKNAPHWEGIVEEGFPESAMTDQSIFFDAVNDPVKLKANQDRMLLSVLRFLDISRINVIPMSEYVIKETGKG